MTSLPPTENMPAAHNLAAAFAAHGTDISFGLPGGGPNLDVIGAFEELGIRFVLAHSETAACIMASAYGYIRDQVVPVVVTRGPGAASAVNGAAQATLDRQPLALITDTVPASLAERVAHQRLNQRAMLGPVSKSSVTFGATSSAEELEALLGYAQQSPAGAVHLNYDNIGTPSGFEPPELPKPIHSRKNVTNRILEAERPVVICGLGAAQAQHQEGCELSTTLQEFAAPVLTTYQGIGVISTEHELAAGLFTNGAAERPLLEQADLIITVGLDPVEPLPASWSYNAPVISFATHPTADPYLPIEAELVGDLSDLCHQHLLASHTWPAGTGADTRATLRAALITQRSAASDESGDTDQEPETIFGAVDLVTTTAANAPSDIIVTVDSGAHFLAVLPFWPVHQPKRLLISNGLGTMGYAVPAAIGAALARPGEPVVAFVGDGGLGMTMAELETIVRLELPITVIVFNDSALSLIEVKQRDGQGGAQAVRYNGTDFATVASGMGMAADVVSTPTQLEGVLATGWSTPRLIDARIDPADYPHLIQITRG